MLEKRIIPILLLDHGQLVKTVNFKNPIYIGDPINTVSIFNNKEVDELFIMDITCNRLNKSPNFELLQNLATEAFMPLGYGGGVNSMEELEKVFSIGFEKVSLNSALFNNLDLLPNAAKAFGSQSLVATIDVQKDFWGNKKVFQHKNKKLHKDVIQWAQKLENLGAGEIILQMVYQEGTFNGYDLDLISDISRKITIPLITLGGAKSLEDLKLALKAGADGAGAGSLFIYHGPLRAVLVNYPTRGEIQKIIES
jgi:cyclase